MAKKTSISEVSAAPAQSATAMHIPELRISTCTVRVRGTSALICHRWSEKAKTEMLQKQMKKATQGKVAKDPEADYQESLYRMPDGVGYGFPAIGFKGAVVRAAKQVGVAMTDMRCAFHINSELVQIHGEPSMREDMVRLGGTTADIRYRGEFKEWVAEIECHYNSSIISEEQLRNLFQVAGFSVGVGEWRPERNGQFGRFEVTA